MKQIIPTITNQKENIVSIDIFHQLLYQISQSTDFNKKEINMVDSAFKKYFPNQSKSSFVQPLRNISGGKILNSKLMISHANEISTNGLTSKLDLSSRIAFELMEDVGYSCCASTGNLKDILAQCIPLKEIDVAHILGMMARTHSGLQENFHFYSLEDPSQTTWENKTQTKTWNVDLFVDTINELYKLDWTLVIEELDHPTFQLYDQRGFNLLISAYKRATKNAPFPLNKLFRIWKNSSGLLSLLKLAVTSTPDFFSFCNPPPSTTLEEFPNNISASVGTVDQHWFSLPLIETLLALSEVENYSIVRLIFDHPISSCPEILFMSITQARVKNLFFFFLKKITYF